MVRASIGDQESECYNILMTLYLAFVPKVGTVLVFTLVRLEEYACHSK